MVSRGVLVIFDVEAIGEGDRALTIISKGRPATILPRRSMAESSPVCRHRQRGELHLKASLTLTRDRVTLNIFPAIEAGLDVELRRP